MVILGIDTALRCTGYGAIRMVSPNDALILDCGVIRNPASAPHSECLRRLAGGTRELVARFNPAAAVVEGAFYQKNIKTAMILSMARGAIVAALAEAGVPVWSYAPRKAKQAVVGNGNAAKDQVAAVLAALFRLRCEDIVLDATDALALALCHGRMAMSPAADVLLDKPL
jgi:crossover junction endodeoxyribonuclease RuvC